MCSATCRYTLTTRHCPHSPAAAAAINRYLLPCPSGPQQQTCSNGSAAVGARWNRLTDRQTDRHRTVSYYTGMQCQHSCWSRGGRAHKFSRPQIVARPLKFSRTLDTLWSNDSQKIRKFDAAGCQILRLKCTKFDFGWGSAPYHAGELTAPQALKLYLRGATSKGR